MKAEHVESVVYRKAAGVFPNPAGLRAVVEPLREEVGRLQGELQDWKNGSLMEREEFEDLCGEAAVRPSTCCSPKYCALAPFHEIKLLRAEIDALKAENAALRQRNSELSAALATQENK